MKPTNEEVAEALAANIANELWEVSALRHGLFTPREFYRLVNARLKHYFVNKPDMMEKLK